MSLVYGADKHVNFLCSVFVITQFFDTIDSAYNYAEMEGDQRGDHHTILIHSGTYKREYLVIDINVTMLGAGK